MTQLEKVLYTAKAHTTGGRDGASRTDDGRLDIKLSPPGLGGSGTNPEQLFAVGYAPAPLFAIALGWLAAAGQLAALATSRYAPYPDVGERPRRGPIRQTIRRIVLAQRRRRAPDERRRALQG